MVISSTGMTSGWKIRNIFSQNYGAGSVMICGRISSEGFTELVIPDGKAFSRLHQSIRRSSPTFWRILFWWKFYFDLFTTMEGSSTPNLTWKTSLGVPGKN